MTLFSSIRRLLPVFSRLMPLFMLATLLFVPAQTWAREGKLNRALELGVGVHIPLTSEFSGLGIAPAGILSYGIMLNPRHELSIDLLSLARYPSETRPLTVFGYGFSFKHYLGGKWLGSSPVVPFFSYSILLNQAVEKGTSGRAIAHNTRLGLGAEYTATERHRLYLVALYGFSDYPYFGKESLSLNFVPVLAGYRMLW